MLTNGNALKKFDISPAGNGFMVRTRLLKLFPKEGNWSIGTLIAPSGYGKTVLISQVAAQMTRVVWIQLDLVANDPVCFLKILIKGLEAYFPNVNLEMYALDLMQGAKFQEVIAQLAGKMTEILGDRFLLVLEDFQYVDDIDVIELVRQLIFYAPKCRILISSQEVLPLAFENLAGREREVVLVTEEELKFTVEETLTLFFDVQSRIAPQEVIKLNHRYRGWNAGLRISLEIIRRGRQIDSRETDCGTDFNSLARQLLELYPEKTQKFLIETALLTGLAPDFCDLLLLRNDSDTLLGQLAQEQLTLLQLREKPNIYRHYHRFRVFLQSCLDENRRLEIMKKMGHLFYEKDELDKAADCLLAAGEYEMASGIINTLAEPLYNAGGLDQRFLSRVTQWLDQIPEGFKLNDVRLGILDAEVQFSYGKLDEADHWVERVIEEWVLRGELTGLNRAMALKAKIMFARGDLGECGKTFEYIAKIGCDAWKEDFSKSQAITIFFAMGRLDLAIRFFERKLAEANAHKRRYGIENLNQALCVLYYVAGDYQQALDFYQAATQRLTEAEFAYSKFLCAPAIYRKRGELERAYEIARQNVEIFEKLGEKSRLSWSYYELAAVYEDRGAFKKAETYYRWAIQLVHNNEGQHFIHCLSQTRLALCMALQGRREDAQKWMEEALRETGGNFVYLKALCHVYCAPILLQSGRSTEAFHMLQNALKYLEQMQAQYPLCLCLGLLAGILEHGRNSQPAARQSAARCLAIASRNHYIQVFLTLSHYLKPVIRMGLEHDYEIDFVQKILERLGESGYKLLMEFAVYPDPKKRLQVLQLLSKMDGFKTAAAIGVFCHDSNPEIREFARIAIAPTEDSESAAKHEEARVQVRSLGSFAVCTPGNTGAPVNWPTKKARELVAYLAQLDRPVSRERIIEDLWSDLNPKKAISLFHTTVYQVRQTLQKISKDSEWIAYQNGDYQLVVACFQIDRIRFEALVANLPEELRSEEVTQVEEVMKLWQGDYLEDLDYPWVVAEREHLKCLYTGARAKLARYYMQNRQYINAIRNLNCLARLNPFSEEFLMAQLNAYAMLGDKSAVQKRYEAYKQALQEELGLSPSREIRNFYYRLCGAPQQTANTGVD